MRKNNTIFVFRLTTLIAISLFQTLLSNAQWVGYPEGNACTVNTEIAGKVYEDINQSGTEDAIDPPLFGINVSLFDDNGQVGATVTTDALGEYSFTGLTPATIYRLEFDVPPTWEEGPYNSESITSVQFVESGRCDMNLGLIDNAHYAAETDPLWVIPCYVTGDPQHPSNINETGVAQFRYSDSGDSPAATYVNYITTGSIGSTWGIAYNAASKNLYMGTVLKRHVGLGPSGIGAIYVHTDGNPNNSASLFYDFGALAGTVAANATRFPGTGNSFGQEGPCGLCDNIDPTTFEQAAKVGFGDIEFDESRTSLYVTNLADRMVYTIDMNNPAAGSAVPLPNMPWLDNSACSNGIARPWALEWRRGQLFVGVVCDASSSSCVPNAACSDLTADVYSFDGTNWTNKLTMTLDYFRDAYRGGSGNGPTKSSDYFVKWLDNWNDMSPFVANVSDVNFGQPILMDIEFDDDNSMILGFGDRTGIQLGYSAPNPTATADDKSEKSFSFGDILRAAYDPATDNFILENNGVVGNLTTNNTVTDSGPGGRSFYSGDYWLTTSLQSGVGSLALLPGSGEVMFNLGDPISVYSSGVAWMDNTDGSNIKRIELYQGTSNGEANNSAKGFGSGDMELMFEEVPKIEIGNIVWWDTDLDGLQDPSEPGIANIPLELWKDPNGNTQANNPVDGDEILVAQTTTDAFGRYIFSYDGHANGLNTQDWSVTADDRVLANTFYQVRVPDYNGNAGASPNGNSAFASLDAFAVTEGFPAGSNIVLSPTQAQGVLNDSNGYDNPDNSAGAVGTGAAGQNDHTFDFAFMAGDPCDASVPEIAVTDNDCDTGTDGTFSVITVCTAGVLEWSTDAGATWTTTAPTYTIDAVVIVSVRCFDAANDCSTSGNTVTSAPEECPCPPNNCINQYGEFTIIKRIP